MMRQPTAGKAETLAVMTARRAKLAATTGGIPRSDPPTKQGRAATREGDGELVDSALLDVRLRFGTLSNEDAPEFLGGIREVFRLDLAAARALCSRFGLDPETGEEMS